MFNKLKRYLARKLLPYAEIKPQVYETTSLDVTSLCYERSFNLKFSEIIPEGVYKREVASELAKALIPYIQFETSEDIYTDSIRYRGVIRIVIDRS